MPSTEKALWKVAVAVIIIIVVTTTSYTCDDLYGR